MFAAKPWFNANLIRGQYGILAFGSMLTSLFLTSAAAAGDFPQFRGPLGTGVAPAMEVPTTWSKDQGLAWKVEISGTGWSQPVVLNKTVYVTAAVSDKLWKPKDMAAGARDPASLPLIGRGKLPDGEVKWQVLAFDANTGKPRWSATVASGKPRFPIHPSNTYATETPAADGERVYAYFGATGTVAALDHQGKKLWATELGAFPIANGFGTGSSPALWDGKLFLNCFNDEKAFVVALEASSGRELWRKERTKAGSAWASPLVWNNSKRVEIVACGDKLVTSHDPSTGAELWRLGGIDTAFAPSPAVDGDMLILAASSPLSASPMYAVRAGATGDITLEGSADSNAGVAWFQTKAKVGMSSPVAAEGYVYMASSGILACYEVATGKRVYQQRLPSGKMVAASVALVGDKLLVVDEGGSAVWVKSGPEFATVGGGQLDDTIWASPAVAENRIFLRGVNGLYCIGKPEP